MIHHVRAACSLVSYLRRPIVHSNLQLKCGSMISKSIPGSTCMQVISRAVGSLSQATICSLNLFDLG
jgi:hypothetical protein